jgi:hypothetical protein
MKLLVNLFEADAVDMGIDLGRGDIGMAQHGLNRAKIGAALQQVRGE